MANIVGLRAVVRSAVRELLGSDNDSNENLTYIAIQYPFIG